MRINFQKIPDFQYFNMKAISSHKVMSFYKSHMDEPNYPKALAKGNIVHGYILESSEQYQVIKETAIETMISKTNLNPNQARLIADQTEMTAEILRARTVDLITGSLTEVVGQIEWRGKLIKGKFDAINLDTRVVVDVKTTSDIKNFQDSIKLYNYDIQAAFYLNLAHQLTGEEYKDFYWAIVDTNKRKVGVVRCPDELIIEGMQKIDGFFTATAFMKDF